ncbi:MAG: phospho-sugar mutase [Gemmataceae bacterium]
MNLLAQAREGFAPIEAEPSLKERALQYLHQWLTEPEFAGYRPQIQWMIEQKQWANLLDSFYQILPFGTGGRRGAMGIGPNRMNLWTLGASVQGHCDYLKERFPGLSPLTVELAYDVRRFEDKRKQYNPDLPNPVLHVSSKDLAHHAAGVYVANGIDAYLLPPDSKRFLATPELSFGIRYLHAQGGLNISASHNPPDDNGGKFYDERGGQPVPPDDQIMADLVDQVHAIKALPWPDAQRSGRIHWLDDAPHHAYIDLCLKQSLAPAPRGEIKVVYTPLHGVGSMTAMEVLLKRGFNVIPVEDQMTPDGQFPNVAPVPNPEVPASMDHAVRTAQANNADLVLSTDPDADRLGCMIPNIFPSSGTPGEASNQPPSPGTPGEGAGVRAWRFVTGNEIAALLTHFKLTQLIQQGRMPSSPIVIKTEVTSSLITLIARHFKAQVVDNLLVGFKYIAEVLRQLEEQGSYEDVRGTPDDMVIACEESHGILVTPQIRDKDAGGAALLLAELALEVKRHKKTMLGYVDQIYRQFGYFRNEGVPVAMTGIQGKEDMARMLDSLRAKPITEIGGLKVTGFEDLRDERGRMGPLKGATDASSRNMLLYHLGDQARIALRPSGTEPKAKTYVEAHSPPCPRNASAGQWQKSCEDVDNLVKRLGAEFQKQALARIGK